MPGTAIRYRWVGADPKDGHINGIPARDLTENAYEALDKDQREAVQKSPFYETTHSRARAHDAEADTARRDDDKPPESAAKR